MRTTTGTRWKVVSALAATSLALAACGSDGGDDDSQTESGSGGEQTALDIRLDELYQEALDEGQTTLTVYGPAAAAYQALTDKFNERFPDITIGLQALVGGDLITRVAGEVTSGQHTADIVFAGGNQGLFEPGSEYDDWFVPLDLEGLEELPEFTVHPDNRWVAPSGGILGFIYNGDRLGDDEIPADWAELAEPEWRDRVATTPLASPSAMSLAMAHALHDGKIDDAWMEAFAANEPQIYPDAARVLQAVLTGEADVGIYPLKNALGDQRNGAPVEFIESTAITALTAWGIVDGAPNPIAAELLLNWFLSPEAQVAFAELAGEVGFMPDAPPPVDGVEVLEAPTAEELNELFPHVLETWGRLLD